jgi:hypothetical protein
MASDEQGDPLSRWIDEHPATLAYIAIVVTASLVLQIVEKL